jgi:hypothetical protein
MTLNADSGQSGAGWDRRPRERSNDGSDIIVPILRSGILAREFCRHGAHVKVEAVFERSIYLRSGDNFVCVGEPAIGNGALSLIADFGVSRPLTSLGLFPGQPASISDRCIAIGDSAKFTFERCVLWRQPPWPLSRSHRELNDLCGVMARQITFESPQEGFGRIFYLHDVGETPLARIARPRIARFESWLSCALDADCMPITASQAPIADLIGLGPGLTPSGDDFLVGALAILDALAERKAHAALARAIAAIPRGLTSALSECLLKAAAAGHVGEDLCCAVSAVVSGKPDQAVAAIRKIGHSSGWDMMVGILTALHVATTRGARPSRNAALLQRQECIDSNK